MNCNLEIIEGLLKKDFPYVVKVKDIIENPSNGSSQPTYSINVIIKQSFFDQLQNNGPLRNIIFQGFSKEVAQVLNRNCPEVKVFEMNGENNLNISLLSDSE
jgi:hypothetical protein